MSGNAAALAAEYHARGFNCAESVFKGVCEACGLKVGALDSGIATAFGFGGGGSGCQCGALAGATMALSLKFGRSDSNASKEKLYAKVRVLHEEFKKACKSSVVCCRILRGKKGEKCDLYVEAAARITAKLIEDG
ncbi:MAG: C-GCAxxG-C-C family protein [Candidatus Micrarchaeota archaeon]